MGLDVGKKSGCDVLVRREVASVAFGKRAATRLIVRSVLSELLRGICFCDYVGFGGHRLQWCGPNHGAGLEKPEPKWDANDLSGRECYGDHRY